MRLTYILEAIAEAETLPVWFAISIFNAQNTDGRLMIGHIASFAALMSTSVHRIDSRRKVATLKTLA
jgi:hypothetical protein